MDPAPLQGCAFGRFMALYGAPRMGRFGTFEWRSDMRRITPFGLLIAAFWAKNAPSARGLAKPRPHRGRSGKMPRGTKDFDGTMGGGGHRAKKDMKGEKTFSHR